ncbi:MAG: hypothetical protein K8R54_13765 [Bacteroidales bacterium]|nr:hypothetical protein [Bacteroidales bacterium]
MKDNTDKYLKEIIKDIKLESPSKDFTKNVMNKISLEGKTVTEIKSSFFKKNKFILIFLITFISIFLIVYFFTDNQDLSILDKINFDLSGLSFFEKLRDFFKVGIKLSSCYLIIPASVFMLFFLDYLIPKIGKMQIDNNLKLFF